MHPIFSVQSIWTAGLLLVSLENVRAQPETPDGPPSTYLLANVVTLHATVVRVDPALRLVVYHDEKTGEDKNFVAGPEVKNFGQIRPGDKITGKVEESLSFLHLKAGANPPIAEDEKNIVTAPTGAKPAGVASTKQRVVTTVVSIDSQVPSITLKYPDNGIRIHKVKNPGNLKEVAPGDTIILTASRKTAVELTAVP
jgi:hypothetical protein